MDFAVDELKPPSEARPEDGGLGAEAPADADLRAYLAGLNSFPLSALDEAPEIVLVAGSPVDPEPSMPAWHSKILNGWTKAK